MGKRLLIALMFLTLGCGTRGARPGDGTGAASGPPGDPYGDPPDYGVDPFSGFGEVVSIAVPGGLSVEEPETPPPAEGRFSVQAAACATAEAAAEVAEHLRGLLDPPVFVDVEGGYHKVRAGAFEDREQALSLQARVRTLGYPDAWVVER